MIDNQIEGSWDEATEAEQQAADATSSAYWRFLEEQLHPKEDEVAALSAEIASTEAAAEARDAL